MVEQDTDGILTLLVGNERNHPMWLEEGQVLGRLEPVSLVESPVEQQCPDAEASTVDNVVALGALVVEPSVEENRPDLGGDVEASNGVVDLAMF